MVGRIQQLPRFEQREALLVWLMLDLQRRGVTQLEAPLAAESIFDASRCMLLEKDRLQNQV